MVVVICHPSAKCCVTDGPHYASVLERLSMADGGKAGERGNAAKVNAGLGGRGRTSGVEGYSPF